MSAAAPVVSSPVNVTQSTPVSPPLTAETTLSKLENLQLPPLPTLQSLPAQVERPPLEAPSHFPPVSSNSTRDLPPVETHRYSVFSTVGKVTQCVGDVVKEVVLHLPHVYLSMTTVFYGLALVTILNLPSLNQIKPSVDPFPAATWMGVVSLTYLCTHHILLKMFPENTIARSWRKVLDISNTLFITLAVSSIWRLKITALQGIALWAVSFGIPFKPLKTWHAYREPIKTV